MSNPDALWQRIVAEIPSRHITGDIAVRLGGARRALHDFACSRLRIRYLEIGTRLGHSLAVVCCASGRGLASATAIDSWIENYGDEPNPGPASVLESLRRLGVDVDRVQLHRSDSHILFLDSAQLSVHPFNYDLIYVDGDHTPEGARRDLENVFPLLANTAGSLLVFDDAVDPLLDVFRDFVHDHDLDDSCTIFPSLDGHPGYGMVRK